MRFLSIIIGLCAILLSGEVRGQSCSITASPVNIGVYDGSSMIPLNATGDISVTCGPGIPYVMKLDAGMNTGGLFGKRKLRSLEGSELSYNVYRDPACTEIWGDGGQNTFTRSGIGTGGAVRFSLFGRIPARQNVPAGLYSDTLIITVEW